MSDDTSQYGNETEYPIPEQEPEVLAVTHEDAEGPTPMDAYEAAEESYGKAPDQDWRPILTSEQITRASNLVLDLARLGIETRVSFSDTGRPDLGRMTIAWEPPYDAEVED